MEIGKMEALGEEAGWKREDEGGQAMESLGTGAREERLGAREERLEAKERVENRKENRSFFIKSCTKKGEI
ncbi:hypothetical protein F7D97_00350 [Prevotella copri]|jgi:sialic acid synthase SpsE|uniref:Uncharacterized protein n=1 Tax=Segatella copri TaxID=165179 RepID=A0A6A7VQP3_9BACT|nr:hypothetical protein [Segatella copri]MQM58189.1 hypothetical protein [Segatella copri]MQN06256.1 hypothetical protein [Segatella copri]MQN08410.1 hypothetical protein [Segatella copri]MQO59703.1 hypothetical protein [Segatella copri]MQO64513.1 hypothetical protein [Segatella copri]